MSSSMSGTSRRASISTSRRRLASGMQLPSGLLKLGIASTAATRWERRRISSRSRSMPVCGWVGTSSARSPRVSTVCRMPKYVGDSSATISPGFVRRAQAKRQRLGGPVGHDHLVRRDLASPFERTPGKLPAQALATGQRGIVDGLGPRAAHGGSHDPVELRHRQERGVRRGGTERNDVGFGRQLENPRAQLAHAHLGGTRGGTRAPQLGREIPRSRAHEEPALGPGIDEAAFFQRDVDLHGRRDADLVLLAEPAHARQAFADCQGAAGDVPRDGIRDPLVQGHSGRSGFGAGMHR